MVASALNHLDLWLRRGMPKPARLPMVPGCDGAGTVGAVGDGVTRWQVGDEVVINPSLACGHCQECLSDRSVFCPRWGIMSETHRGAHAASVVVGEANLVPRPATLGWEQAAAYGLCGLTAYRMLQRGRLCAGETLLVVGVGGGVGNLALVLGVRMGRGCTSPPATRTSEPALWSWGRWRAFTSGDRLPVKADVVVDSAGAPTWAAAMGALRPGGRLVTCGGTGGAKVELNLPKLFFGQFEVIGSTMGTFREFDELSRLVADGLPVVVDRTYPWDEYPAALARLESAEQFGKIVLRHS